MAIKNLILARGRLGGVAFIPTLGFTPSTVVLPPTSEGLQYKCPPNPMHYRAPPNITDYKAPANPTDYKA